MPGLSDKSESPLCRRIALVSSFGIFFLCLIFSPAFAQAELSVLSATASSSYSSSYAPSKAIDNNLTTYWRGKNSQAYWWLRLDLGKAYSLNQISIWWDKSYGSTNYALQASNDGTSWTTLSQGLSSAGGTTNPYKLTHNLSGAYRYVRIYITKPQKSYPKIYEVKTYGAPTDTTAPTGSIKINNDSQYTKSTAVTLTLSAQDEPGGSGLSQMQFSSDGTSWSVPEAYSTTKSWTMPTGDGSKAVYVKYKDAAGNWSPAYSDTIVLDTAAPAIYLNPVSSPTNQNVILSYNVTDGLTPTAQIVVTGDNSPYLNEGNYNVTLTAQDLAGNSASSQVSFTIDKTPPVIIITSPADGAVVEDSPILLQGTVDGVSFSESRTLKEGENTLAKSATDPAGNTHSASVTVHLYLGQAVGPDGGEVASSDGRVRVVIPAGALLSPTQIKVVAVSKESLTDAAPSGRSLLSVVECKPYGLVFAKPVEIIYTLTNPEIPGTPVELGLYDAVQDAIISTGQNSTVPADGYTLSFSILHFSTYAALKNLIAQSTPIGSYVKIPLADMLTGSFSHAIPLTVIPGRKGIQPALGLSYRSSNPNSWTGLGFSLNPGYIVRSTRLGPPSYDDTRDTFYFITNSGTTELVHLIDNLYQAKIESTFTKFYKETDDSWKAVGKEGSVLRFGQSADSKETSNSGTFSWYITKAQDTNGNYLTYSYAQDQGKAYLNHIDYTGNEAGVSPTNTVEFLLEPREDTVSSYISTSKIATTRRLKEILVKQNQELVWRYVLEYAYSPDTHRSLLRSVTQYGADGKALPTQRMTYQSAK